MKKQVKIIFLIGAAICFSTLQIYANLELNTRKIATKEKDNVKISIQLVGAKKNDSLVIRVFHHFLGEHSFNNYKEYSAGINASKSFDFSFPIDDSKAYILLGIRKAAKIEGKDQFDAVLMPYYFVEKQDSLKIKIKPAKLNDNSFDYHRLNISFSGAGAIKYEAKFKLDSIFYNNYDGATGLQPDGHYRQTDIQKAIIKTGLIQLEKRKRLMKRSTVDLLETDFLYSVKNAECETLIGNFKKSDKSKRDNFISVFKSFQELGINPHSLPPSSISNEYTQYQVNECKLKEVLAKGVINIDTLYFRIRSSYTGVLLDRAICLYFSLNSFRIKNYSNILRDALIRLKGSAYFNDLNGYSSRIIGASAYNFNLPDTSGNRISLKNFNGKVIVMDFWFTGCPGCRKFYGDNLSKVESEFKNNKDVVFISVCIDTRRENWLQSINSGHYTSKSVINLYTDGIGIKNPIIENYKILAYPQPIILDRQQRIVQFGNMEISTATNMIDQINRLL
ncbi:TlpA family protein disulfide reductase [Mucilaginibacter paludis]|uniref:Alkyl hydroperoxide reductase/ Thiol specific antioxidant/ Mal allergen n=1 Tax=Mucilaginibacter paludis DSM 18603 TaxID=714943 RepID=H1Y401_9SPHI|nr:TlpA disulfide reductase family protein [Mucilaginibacter paludis]EHQ30946.1 alkyl hydroperoxide reductase/ Thiol specific antioxidant/ Mal allergen [Mucilaginibacter paludis DSM 18603]